MNDVPVISLNMVICNNRPQTKTHSSYEIMHCTPPLVNTITLCLSTKGMRDVNIFHAACLVLSRVREKQHAGVGVWCHMLSEEAARSLPLLLSQGPVHF